MDAYIAGQLTGQQRHRVNWRGKLVLQVQQNVTVLENCGSHVDTRPAVIWRDAKTTDVTVQP